MSGGAEARLLGRWGERLVSEHLRMQGWSIRETNYRCRLGELDIIAENKCYIAFVEVKLRKTNGYGLPREAVTREKQRKLRATAELYLQDHLTSLQPRFDVAEVYAPQGLHTAAPEIIYIDNAF